MCCGDGKCERCERRREIARQREELMSLPHRSLVTRLLACRSARDRAEAQVAELAESVTLRGNERDTYKAMADKALRERDRDYLTYEEHNKVVDAYVNMMKRSLDDMKERLAKVEAERDAARDDAEMFLDTANALHKQHSELRGRIQDALDA